MRRVHWPTSRVQNAARRILGLPPEPAEKLGIGFWVERREDGFSDVLDHSGRREDADWAQFHADGRRGLAADRIGRAPFIARSAAERAWSAASEPVRGWRRRRALLAARELRFTSPYIISELHESVDGPLTAGKAEYWLEVRRPEALARAAESAWNSGEVLADAAEWAPVVLTVPQDAGPLTDEVIAEAIARWYSQQAEFVPGHWTAVERALPRVIVDLARSTLEEDAAGWAGEGASRDEILTGFEEGDRAAADVDRRRGKRRLARFGR